MGNRKAARLHAWFSNPVVAAAHSDFRHSRSDVPNPVGVSSTNSHTLKIMGSSSALRDLVIGSGLEYEEHGAHELKGVLGEGHLFAVASP